MSNSSNFEGCDLATLGSTDLVRLSACWRDDKIRMVHRADGKVNLTLACGGGGCSCARALAKGPPLGGT